MTTIKKFQELNNVSLFINDEASGAIKSYLKTLSANTQKNYIGRFNKFLYAITGATIDNVIWKQIKNITYTEIASYSELLVSEKYKNKSINQIMSSIAELFKFLSVKYKQYNIDPAIFITVPLPESEHDTNSYGILTEEETYNLFDYASTVRYRPASQQLFFETLFITGLRFDAILTLNTKNITHVVDPATKKMVYLIKTVDKSKDRTVAITDELALRLLNEPNNHDGKYSVPEEGSIFDLGNQCLRKTLANFCKAYDISEERNIKLHSIKKAAINNALTITNGNITEVAKFAGHSDINTTLKYYTDMNTNYTEQLSMRNGKDENDMLKLELLSKEELLQLISKAGIGTVKKLVAIMDS